MNYFLGRPVPNLIDAVSTLLYLLRRHGVALGRSGEHRLPLLAVAGPNLSHRQVQPATDPVNPAPGPDPKSVGWGERGGRRCCVFGFGGGEGETPASPSSP